MKISFWEFISVAGGERGMEESEREEKRDNKRDWRQEMRDERWESDNKDNKKGLRLVSIMLFYDRCVVRPPPPFASTPLLLAVYLIWAYYEFNPFLVFVGYLNNCLHKSLAPEEERSRS